MNCPETRTVVLRSVRAVTQRDCEGCPAHGTDLFAAASREDPGRMMNSFRLVALEARHKLYLAEDAADYVYLMRSGLVKLVRYSASCEERIVRLARPGDTLGLESLLQQPYRHCAFAVTRAELCRVPARTMREHLRNDAHFAARLLGELQANLDAADLFLTELSTGSVSARVARLLLYLAEKPHGSEFLLMTREEMGALLGVTRESVSHVLADLRRSGIVDWADDHRMRGWDTAALQQIAAS